MDVFSTYKDDFVQLEAVYYEEGRKESFNEKEDNRGYVECTILKEEEQAYKTALEYLIQIIKEGFSVRFDFNLTSSVNNFTQLFDSSEDEEDCLETDCNKFFTNAVQYPGLRDLMRQFVKISAEKIVVFEVEEMGEDDSTNGRRPDFFAAAALILSDPTGYDYLTTFDVFAETVSFDQSYSGIHMLEDSFLKKYGVNDQNIGNIIETFKEEKAGNFIVFQLYDWSVEEIDGYEEIATQLLESIEEYSEEEWAEQAIEQLQETLEAD